MDIDNNHVTKLGELKSLIDGLWGKITTAISTATSGLLSKTDADGYYQEKGSYATPSQLNSLGASMQGQIDGINLKIPESASPTNQMATAADIPDVSGFETSEHAASTYATKSEIPDVNGKVSKAGDTMTGNLVVNVSNDNSQVMVKQGDNNLSFAYNTSGARGIWDSKLDKWILNANDDNVVSLSGNADTASNCNFAKRSNLETHVVKRTASSAAAGTMYYPDNQEKYGWLIGGLTGATGSFYFIKRDSNGTGSTAATIDSSGNYSGTAASATCVKGNFTGTITRDICIRGATDGNLVIAAPGSSSEETPVIHSIIFRLGGSLSYTGNTTFNITSTGFDGNSTGTYNSRSYNNNDSDKQYVTSLTVKRATKVHYINCNSTNYTTYGAPTSGWYVYETTGHADGDTYAIQTAQSYGGTRFYRSKNNGSWGEWKQVVNTGTSAVGSSTQPVYVDSSGKVQACTNNSMTVGYAKNISSTTGIGGNYNPVFVSTSGLKECGFSISILSAAPSSYSSNTIYFIG